MQLYCVPVIIEDDSYSPVSGSVDPELDVGWRRWLGENRSADVFFELVAPPCNIAEDGIWRGFAYETRAGSGEGGCKARD